MTIMTRLSIRPLAACLWIASALVILKPLSLSGGGEPGAAGEMSLACVDGSEDGPCEEAHHLERRHQTLIGAALMSLAWAVG